MGCLFQSKSVKTNSSVEISFDSEMASLLDSSQKRNYIVITPSSVKEAVLNLRKKKFLACTDSICADHFIAANDLLYNHLASPFQMVFNVGGVRDSLSIGVISPILRNRVKENLHVHDIDH